jgi:hypothetical protein
MTGSVGAPAERSSKGDGATVGAASGGAGGGAGNVGGSGRSGVTWSVHADPSHHRRPGAPLGSVYQPAGTPSFVPMSLLRAHRATPATRTPRRR